MKRNVLIVKNGVVMPRRRAIDRIKVRNRITGKIKWIKVIPRSIDQWKDNDFSVNANQAEQLLRKAGKWENGMIVIDY